MHPLPSFARKPAVQAAGIGVLLFAVYMANGDFLTTADSVPNTYVSSSLLREGNLSFTPEEAPFMFRWEIVRGEEITAVEVRRWDQAFGSATAEELRRRGELKVVEPLYYLVPSVRKGEYVGIYGPGPGLAALPFFAVGEAVWGDLRTRRGVASWIGKTAAAAFAAASAAVLFLAALLRATPRAAGLLALSYGLGTCVWSQSSQALWQQTPILFFCALALWALLRSTEVPTTLALAGLGLGAAVVCRPTWGLVLVATGLGLLRMRPRSAVVFGVGAAAPMALLLSYMVSHRESLVDFGQMEVAAYMALQKTGDMDVWQTPPWRGAAGQLLSPARGLLVYSPFLAFAAWGARVAWRDRAFVALRAPMLGLLALLYLGFQWFDWWGGHSFGPRLLVDAVPILVALLIPVADRLLAAPRVLAVFLALVAWSTALQVLGAFAYDQTGWNARTEGIEVRLPGRFRPVVAATPQEAAALGGRILGPHRLDVDRPDYRARLWSWSDNPVFYYAARFGPSRARKKARLRDFLDGS